MLRSPALILSLVLAPTTAATTWRISLEQQLGMSAGRAVKLQPGGDEVAPDASSNPRARSRPKSRDRPSRRQPLRRTRVEATPSRAPRRARRRARGARRRSRARARPAARSGGCRAARPRARRAPRAARRPGTGEQGRAVQHARERARELGVAHRLGRDRVHRSGVALVAQRRADQRHDVVHVDPGHPLAAVAEPPAQAEAEGPRHQRQRAALARQHDADPQHHAADSVARGRQRLGLPGAADLGEESLARRRVLVEELVSAGEP